MTDFAETLESIGRDVRALRTALGGVIVGQEQLLHDLLVAMFAGGHVLLEGLPGLGKTQLAKAVTAALGVRLGRVQCTPDLLPADITGSEILNGERGDIEFRPGPVFANIVLIDEINRATPRTQAALLEAMQERQVTYGGTNYPLPHPFWLIATQNPIELEGTFPLPEAQLDRFLFKISVSYPSAHSLEQLLDTSLDHEPADELKAVLTVERAAEIIDAARQVIVAEPVRKAAIDLVLSTQPLSGQASKAAREHVRYGASPRALQAIIRTARVRALFAGRAHTSFDDLHAVARPVLSHRILLKTVERARWRYGRCSGRPDPRRVAQRAWRVTMTANTLIDELRLRRFARLAAPMLRGNALQGTGQRAARNRAGAGLEFLDLREYTPGEDVRHIDWRQTARRRRLLVRRYRDEAASDWLLCVDGSASMGRGRKWQLAVELAAALAYTIISAGHRASLVIFAERIHAFCPPGRGQRQFAVIARQLTGFQPAEQGGASVAGLCAGRVSRSGNLVLLSDFLRDDAMTDDLRRVRGKRRGGQCYPDHR